MCLSRGRMDSLSLRGGSRPSFIKLSDYLGRHESPDAYLSDLIIYISVKDVWVGVTSAPTV